MQAGVRTGYSDLLQHGPVGQDIYGRFGAAFPISKGLLSKGLNPGWTGQIGARSLYFNTTGDAAWVLDGHVTYTYNNANNRQDIATALQRFHQEGRAR